MVEWTMDTLAEHILGQMDAMRDRETERDRTMASIMRRAEAAIDQRLADHEIAIKAMVERLDRIEGLAAGEHATIANIRSTLAIYLTVVTIAISIVVVVIGLVKP